MNILMTGATGLVGSHLTRHLNKSGHQVTALPRTSDPSMTPRWLPARQEIELPLTNPFEAVIHLAGHPIACRWTESNKRKIRDSRVEGTRLLSQALAQAEPRPKVLISASATGYYGDRGEEWLEEDSAAGTGFLAEVAREWEAATREAQAAGIRTVHLRFGIVLSPDGGALARMLPIFRWGMGGRVGDGHQFWSWISLPDLLRAISFCLETPGLSGAVNAVSPHPVTNQEFTHLMGTVLHRPTIIPLPKFAAKLALGQMAEEALLASTRVRSRRLLDAKFNFQHPDLETALAALLQP